MLIRNTNTKPAYIKTCSQQGFTLLELMIAISLSLLLTGIVIQSFLSNKETYRLTEGVSRVQENIRFGAHFISTDIRQAGNLGCIQQVRNVLNPNDLFDLSSPIIGWDYNKTGIDNIDTTIKLSSTKIGSTASIDMVETNWIDGSSPKIPVPSEVDDLLVKNSDIILIKKIKPTDIVLKPSNPPTNVASDPTLETKDEHELDKGKVILVGDCLSADLTQITAASTSVIDVTASTAVKPGTSYNTNLAELQPWSFNWGENATVYEFVSELYFVGKRANSSSSSLYRIQIDGTDTNEPQELIEGIDTLQIIYGIDTDIGASADQIPNRFVSADKINDWSQVVSVRFSMLARSSENTTDIDQDTETSNQSQQETYRMLSHLDIQPNDGNADRILRYVVNSTVQPRNTAVPDDLAYNICKANTIDPVFGDCDALRIVLP